MINLPFFIGVYSNGKKEVSKTLGSTALNRDVGVRIPPPQPNNIEEEK